MGMFVVTPSSTESMIPLLTTNTPDGDDFITGSNRTDMIKFWHHHHHQDKTKSGTDEIQFDQHHQDGEGEGGAATCQDCGNQAKKDCTYGRCRTCCKSRAFECSTHVKSTWVPSYRRRERQMVGGGGGASSGSTSGAKKPRVLPSATATHTSTSNTPPTPSRQEASMKESLPGQVTAAAVFKCVRVTSVEDGDDEYAYQAVVKIGGHVFKGFLYDQGVEPRGGFPSLSELHLGGGTSGAGGGDGGGKNGGSSTTPPVHPSDVYGSATLLGGSTYGNNSN